MKKRVVKKNLLSLDIIAIIIFYISFYFLYLGKHLYWFLVICVAVVIAIFSYFLKEEKDLKGFGGWLLFYMVGFVAGSILILLPLGLKYFLISEGLILKLLGLLYISLFIWSIRIIFLTFKKRKITPSKHIIFLWVSFGLSLFTLDITTIIGAFIASSIWSNYWYKSKRVKNTFVNKK